MGPPSKKLKVAHTDNSDPNSTSEDPIPTDASQTEDQDISGQRTLFVRSLNYSTTTESLSAHFSYIAPLKHATVVVDPSTKSSRGFGFVTFTDPADAAKAVKEFNGKLFEGRHIKVEVAQARHRDGGDGATVASHAAKQKEVEVKKRNPRLIVRNLAWSVKKPEQLEQFFEKFGKVKEIIIPRKDGSKHGPMSGFAFVTLKKEESARKAIEAVNGTEIEGRVVAVDWAVEKDEWKKKVANEENGEISEAENEDSKEDAMDLDKEDSDVDSESDPDPGSNDSDDSSDALDDEADSISDMSDESSKPALSTNETVVFIRNLAFTTDEDALYEHFRDNFGPIRYARVVLEHDTGRPRGTAFVSFYRDEDFESCLADAPKNTIQSIPSGGKGSTKQSVLQSESLDPTGKYTLGGRVLSISRAVSKDEAGKLTAAGSAVREKAKNEKRRLYLLNEGQISPTNPLYQELSGADIKMREDSYKQRKTFLEKNTSLHLSLTRLSVRNIPRNITEKDLKMLARKAIVEFASEVKDGKRGKISKEEASRGGTEAKEKEAERKAKGKGVVRQAKIVREKGGGRSKGYGFIEYIGHRWALMGLRWLNGREVAHLPAEAAGREKEEKKSEEGEEERKKDLLEVAPEDRKRRLIVEFALENVQVVERRQEREKAAKGRIPRTKRVSDGDEETGKRAFKKGDLKRKRQQSGEDGEKETAVVNGKGDGEARGGKGKGNPEKEDKQLRASRIIARKRQKRRMRKGSA
ncbi:Nucleolin [Dactylella cylindrospora]|nr:Nucleolin [Dactylella cylindrospora]